MKALLSKIKKLFKRQPSGADIVEGLRRRGVQVGQNVDIIDSFIDVCHGRLISIGDNVTITGARILAHDASTKKQLGYSKIGLVKIGNNVFIGNGCIVLPGTTVGNNVVLGAGSVIASDVPDNSVMIGNPARKLCSFDEYIERNRQRLNSSDAFVSDIRFCDRTDEQWAEMKAEMASKKYAYDV